MGLQVAVKRCANALIASWNVLQVSHRGKYSIERMLALEEYVRSTSTARALLVFIGTPLPSLAVALLTDCIPLGNPSDGWQANPGAWWRAAILTVVLAIMFGYEAREQIPGCPLTKRQLVTLTVWVTALYMPIAIGIAAVWVFPIPFMLLVVSVPYLVICLGCIGCLIGARGLQRIEEQTPGAIKRHLDLIQAQNVLIAVYPAFQALFNAARARSYELPVLLLMPWLKISLKHMIARCAGHLEDLMPVLVVGTVEAFNAFYLATCIQRISSASTASIVFAVDVAQNVLVLRRIRSNTARVWSRHKRLYGSRWRGSLLDAVHSLAVTPRKLTTQSLDNIRVRSCVKHSLSGKATEILSQLEQGQPCLIAPYRTRGTRHIVPMLGDKPIGITGIGPNTSAVSDRVGNAPSSGDVVPRHELAVGQTDRTTTRPRSTRVGDLLAESHRVLFTIEYVLLAEYFELFSPFLYVGYMAGMSRLPSARYHDELTDLRDADLRRTLNSNLLFALLKVASFVLLLATLRRVSCHNGLLHLAFVLETHMARIQWRMFACLLVILGFRIVHYGEHPRAAEL